MSESGWAERKFFFLLGFKGERSPGASVLRRRGVGDARDCPRGPSEAFCDELGAFRRPDGLHRAVPGRLRLRHFSRVPVTRFLLIPVRSLTRIPRFDPTVPPIPHRRPPRADRGPAGAPNLPHEALVPRRHPREVQVLVRKTNIFLRDERDARRTTRGKASEREGRALSTRSRRCPVRCMRDRTRAGEGLAARTPGDIFRHLASTRESVFAKRVLRVLR